MTGRIATAAAVAAFACGATVHAGAAPLRGAVVVRVSPGGRGELAGIEVGDVATACNGKPVVSPRDLADILVAARENLTVKIQVYRGGGTREHDIIPGAPDIHCEQFFRGYEAFLAGPSASPELNGLVRAGYEAFEKKLWREAAEHFEKAVGEGFRDRDVLRHLTNACVRIMAVEKAHRHASALLNLDPSNGGSVRLLYLTCLMSGRYGQAARVAQLMPRPGGFLARMVDRKRDAWSLTRAEANRKLYLAAGGDVTKPLDPLAGGNALTRGLRDLKIKDFRGGELTEYVGSVRFDGGSDRVRDFVFSFVVEVPFLTWDWEERPIVAHVCDEENHPLLNVGVDQWGRLLLGQNWYEIVGPTEATRAPPAKNEVKVVRQGARIDAFMNGKYVASTFVAPEQRLRLYLAYTNGAFLLENVALATPRAVDEP